MDMSGLFASQAMMGMSMGQIYANAFAQSLGLPGAPAPLWGGQPLLGNSPQQLFGGTFDPSQVVPGLGVAASGMPQQPPREVLFAFGRMQESHRNDAMAFLETTKEDIAERKDEVFHKYHYKMDDAGKVGLYKVDDKGAFVTDEEGNLVPDKSGKPRLEEGSETYEQNKARRLYEKDLTKQLKARQEQEADALRQRVALEQDRFMADPSTILNPQKAEEYRILMEDLGAQELAMTERHFFEEQGVGLEGLPDLQNPGSTLADFVKGRQDEYGQMKVAFQQEEEASPEGQQIREYLERQREFTERQKEAVRSFLSSLPPGYYGA